MEITIPDLPASLEMLLALTSTFDGQTQTIAQWVDAARGDIVENNALINEHAPQNVRILAVFLRDLLSRRMRGESSQRLYEALVRTIRTEDDLTEERYGAALRDARYGLGVEVGASVIRATVGYFRDDRNWDWRGYFDLAETAREDGFPNDRLLKIKYVKYKVRDLALANFNRNYAAFDVHLPRVLSRTGLLAYGWDMQLGPNAESATNPSNERNYLFLHGLLLHMSALCDGQFSPVDLDRIFWHFGRTICSDIMRCENCPIEDTCCTGRQRAANG
jgi:endonuclease III